MDDWMEISLINHHLLKHSHFLKLGHHGSRYSTSTELLKTVSPAFVWNSCGVHNRYGHPHPLVLNRLHNHNISWLSTHQDGAITFRISSSEVVVASKLSNRQFLIKDRGWGLGYICLCEPSQYGNDLECLHKHKLTVFGAFMVMVFGSNSVPLWFPSQNGWLSDSPQVQMS